MAESGWNVCRASTSLQDLLPESVAREHRAVVLARDADGLVVACAEQFGAEHTAPVDGAGHRAALPASQGPTVAVMQATTAARRRQAVSQATGQPVRLISAATAEVNLALAACRGIGDLKSLRWERFRSLADDCGLLHVLEESDRKGHSPAVGYAGDRVTEATNALTDGWGPELLGLLEGLPHLSPADADFEPALCVFVPPSVREEWDESPIVPWGLEDGYLLLGCASAANEAVLTATAAWTGLPVRPILCDVQELRAIIRAFQQGEFIHSRPRGGSARYAITGTQSPDGGGSAYRDSLAAIPAALARSLAIVPIISGQHTLTIGIASDNSEIDAIREAIGVLTGRTVRLHTMSADRLHSSLDHYYSKVHEDAAPALSVIAGTSGRLPTRDGESSAISRHLHAVPSIRLRYYAIKPQVIGQIPRDLLEAHCAVPLRRDGSVLWVAMAQPDTQVVNTLSVAAGCTIRPIRAMKQEILERLEMCNVSARALDLYERHPVVNYLQQHARLDSARLLELLDRPGLAIDDALKTAGLIDHDEFARVISQLSGLSTANLRHSGKLEYVGRGAGRPPRVALRHDIVDPSVAAEIPLDLARSLGMLPIRREFRADTAKVSDRAQGPGAARSCIVVAVADPCSQEVVTALEARSLTPYRLVVAPRPDILAAIAGAGGGAQLGERLLLSQIVTEDDLESAIALHRSSGVRIGQALITLSFITQEQLAYFLAEQLNLPFVGLAGMSHDADLAHLLPATVERRLGVLPLYETEDALIAVMPDPLDAPAREEAEALIGRPIQPMVCTEADFEAALETLYRDQYLERSSAGLATQAPEESASRVVTRPQITTFVVAGLLSLILLWRMPLAFGIGITAVCTLLYSSFSLYRGYLVYRAASHDLEIPVTDEELAALDESTLPIYTVLVPLYREASVLPTLIGGLARLDYPATKLDVKLLLEEDDRETLEAVAAMDLPAYVRPVVVPAALPRGKPKACNYGLIHARGEYVVIYDAEDVPDPDQLKKAVISFRKVPADIACLQAKLSYYNSDQNLLTRWFAIEYSMWFDLFLPGLDASNAPVPLGGTSNHFRTAQLLEVGAWDPYNVTEDADLGIRLYRRGWRTAVIESTTYEEATSEVYNWIRQRSRWVKGYVQTYLVHMRHPIQLWQSIGGKAFLSFNLVVGGTFFGFLVNPILWCLTAMWYLGHSHVIAELFPAPLFYMSALSLAIGNTAFVYVNVAGCLRPGMYDKVKYALLSPLYWALMSLAAWKGFLQLWWKPFYWEKTIHGRYQTSHVPATTSTAAPVSATQQVEVA